MDICTNREKLHFRKAVINDLIKYAQMIREAVELDIAEKQKGIEIERKKIEALKLLRCTSCHACSGISSKNIVLARANVKKAIKAKAIKETVLANIMANMNELHYIDLALDKSLTNTYDTPNPKTEKASI